jgi:hypothetical protein
VNNTKKFALISALAFAMAGSAMAQSTGGSTGTAASTDGSMAASGAMGMHKKTTHGTTLHQQDKASHLRGASAAAAASAMGTNDKGAPH